MGSFGGEYSPTPPVAQAPASSRLLSKIQLIIFLTLDIFINKTPYNIIELS